MCEWNMEVHAACKGDVFGKQESKNPYGAGFDK
jgi:hypothetical protein